MAVITYLQRKITVKGLQKIQIELLTPFGSLKSTILNTP